MQDSNDLIECKCCQQMINDAFRFCPYCGTQVNRDDILLGTRLPDFSNSISKVKINRLALLSFFDAKTEYSVGHATAINAVAGEELGAGLLAHYFEHVRGVPATVLNARATQGKPRGERLNYWMKVEWPEQTILYQIEVKNWSAHSIGGRPLRDDAGTTEIADYKLREWNGRIWNVEAQQFRPAALKINKVLIPMIRPLPDFPIEPVACMWAPMHPSGEPEPWFSVELPSGQSFAKLHVFSMSSYLRTLSDSHLVITMPATVMRIRWLAHLFQPEI